VFFQQQNNRKRKVVLISWNFSLMVLLLGCVIVLSAALDLDCAMPNFRLLMSLYYFLLRGCHQYSVNRLLFRSRRIENRASWK
jgi:hypothetical protein